MIPLRDNIASSRVPWISYAVLAANVLVFLWQFSVPGQPVRVLADGHWLVLQDSFNLSVWTYGLRPAEIVGGASLPPATPVPEWLTLLSSMFMHGGLLHIGSNMLYLWIFADNVEDAMGHRRFLVFYVLAGLAAAAAQIATNPHSTIPMVGASGAIAGVLGAYLVLYPRARVLTAVPIFFFIRIMEIPAIFFLGFWIILQVLSAATSPATGGGTAWFAHIGGFAFGLLGAHVFAQGRVRPRLKW